MEERVNDSTTNVYDYGYAMDENMSETDLRDVLRCPSTNLPFSHIYLPMLYFFMFFIGVSGNIFVIWVMCTKRKSSRLVDTFVINLALADLVFVLTLPLWAVSAAQKHNWAFGEGMCKLSSYIIAVNRFSNIFFLTCMGIDRYLAVVRMLDSRYLRRSQCIQITCGVVWVSSFTLATPSLVFRKTTQVGEATFCLEDEESILFQVLSLVTLFLTFVLPISIILFCYGSILIQLQHHNGVGGARTEDRRRHSVKMVFTIIVAFVVSWLPFNFFKSVLITSQLQEMELSCRVAAFLARGLILSSSLAFLNSCANPVIYMLLDHHFKHSARILCYGCMSEQQGHVLSFPSPSSFSDSISWLTFPRSRSRSVSKSSHLGTTVTK
ncbi:putative G-protein coupled receptor 25 [Scleropages formosus]|uniref:Putative G-protein coupled receptor 25 n=2 Tax=Scleropages formosus TaxID=113540 RepID=A0A0P7UDB5_SCLFO|nr:putative G-protein coupled receptor 25 [Scleropages formosus]